MPLTQLKRGLTTAQLCWKILPSTFSRTISPQEGMRSKSTSQSKCTAVFKVLCVTYIYVCVCNCPPVHEVCPNYDVVMFQPRTETPPHLGSVASVTNLIQPSCPTCFYHFSGSSFSLLYPISHLSAAVHRRSPLSVCCTRSPPSLPEQSTTHLDAARTRHLPDSADSICVQRRVTVYDAITRDCSAPPPPPPLPPLACTQVHVIPRGVCPLRFPTSPLFPHLVLPECSSESLHLPVLSLSAGWIFAQGREARAPPLPGSCSPWPSLPPLLGHSGAIEATPPPPPVVLIPSPLVDSVGRRARSCVTYIKWVEWKWVIKVATV